MLIVFEGPNGSGKTTLIRNVAELLAKQGDEASVVKFPSSQDIGLLCRKYAAEDAAPHALACLIAADFYRGVKQEIEPQLARGAHVLCDRFVLSTFVYQTMHGVSQQFLECVLGHLPVPDHVFLLIASADTLRARRSRSEDAFDAPERASYEVAEYEKYAKTPPRQSGPIQLLDAQRSAAELVELAMSALKRLKAGAGHEGIRR